MQWLCPSFHFLYCWNPEPNTFNTCGWFVQYLSLLLQVMCTFSFLLNFPILGLTSDMKDKAGTWFHAFIHHLHTFPHPPRGHTLCLGLSYLPKVHYYHTIQTLWVDESQITPWLLTLPSRVLCFVLTFVFAQFDFALWFVHFHMFITSQTQTFCSLSKFLNIFGTI